MNISDPVIRPPLPGEAGQPSGRRIRWGWALSVLLLIPLMLLVDQGYQQLRDTAQEPLLRLVIKGETLHLDSAAQAELASMLPAEITAYERHIRSDMQRWTDRQLHQAFAALEAGVDPYLDWHFSAGGSYMRLLVALGGDLDDWTARQVQERLVAATDFDDHIAGLENRFINELDRVQRDRMQLVQQAIYDRFAAYRQAGGETEDDNAYALDMDLLVGELLDVRLDSARFGTSIGAGLAGGMVARRIATGPALQQGRLLVTRFLARMGVQAGRSAAVAGGAAGASAPATGPGALVVGGVVFAGTLAAFVGTEYLALNLQEKAQRPQLEAQLREDIVGARAALAAQLRGITVRSSRATAQAFLADIDTAQRVQGVPERYWIFSPG